MRPMNAASSYLKSWYGIPRLKNVLGSFPGWRYVLSWSPLVFSSEFREQTGDLMSIGSAPSPGDFISSLFLCFRSFIGPSDNPTNN